MDISKIKIKSKAARRPGRPAGSTDTELAEIRAVVVERLVEFSALGPVAEVLAEDQAVDVTEILQGTLEEYGRQERTSLQSLVTGLKNQMPENLKINFDNSDGSANLQPAKS